MLGTPETDNSSQRLSMVVLSARSMARSESARPTGLSCLAVSSRPAPSRSTSTRSAPASASRMAMARPIPDPAPATRARPPLRSRSFSIDGVLLAMARFPFTCHGNDLSAIRTGAPVLDRRLTLGLQQGPTQAHHVHGTNAVVDADVDAVGRPSVPGGRAHIIVSRELARPGYRTQATGEYEPHLHALRDAEGRDIATHTGLRPLTGGSCRAAERRLPRR